jgi:hypothetical protein
MKQKVSNELRPVIPSIIKDDINHSFVLFFNQFLKQSYGRLRIDPLRFFNDYHMILNIVGVNGK